jgi:hypothetical protein
MSVPVEIDEAKALIALQLGAAPGQAPPFPCWYDGVEIKWLGLDRVFVGFVKATEAGAQLMVRSFEFDISRSALNSHELWEEPPSVSESEE